MPGSRNNRATVAVGLYERGASPLWGANFEGRGKSYGEIYRSAVRAQPSNLTLVESNKEAGTIKAEARAG